MIEYSTDLGPFAQWLTKDKTIAELSTSDFKRRVEQEISANLDFSEKINEIKAAIRSGKAAILRDFGAEPKCLPVLAHAIGQRLHSSPYFDLLSTLAVQPFSQSLSETSSIIPFHTDFASDINPPEVLILQCNEPDPRFPDYGRNQVLPLALLLDRIKEKFPGGLEKFKNLVFSIGENAKIGPVLSSSENDPWIRWPSPLIDANNLGPEHYYKGCSWIDIVEELGKSFCSDFVLDKGDVAICSNRNALHRRGECSIEFLPNGSYLGRKITTLRFYN